MLKKLLIANRAEIAIRVARTAAEMGIATVAVFAEDDAQSLHTRKSDDAHGLKGSGAAAYLDGEQIVAVAREAGCDAIHPGYGFLSENGDFARRCAQAHLVFVGPAPETLDLFGDKAKARALAEKSSVPVLRGTKGGIGLDEARKFLAAANGPIMLKALAGGGGRGMRPVHSTDELEQAFERCRSEALQAFGNGELYAEELFARARHIEVQIVGDGTGAVSHLWDRECSLQRQRQKLIELAPALGLPEPLRRKLFDAAVALGKASRYKNLGTIEFLVDGAGRFAFIEANARLQVEHTVTEEVTGLDLVRIQLEIAAGRSLRGLHLEQTDVPAPRGAALQARINLETMGPGGVARPAGGTLAVYEPPSGRGVRVDGFGYAGYKTSARYDSLLAKLIVHSASDSIEAVALKAYRALCEFRIEGAPTNIPFLQTLVRHPALADGTLHTRFVEEHMAELLAGADVEHRRLFFEPPRAASRAGVKVDSADPLAVLHHGKRAGRNGRARHIRRARRRDGTARAAAGDHREPCSWAGRHGAGGRARARHGSDEDGACDRGECRRHRARAGGGAGRHGVRGRDTRLHRGSGHRGRRRGRRRRHRSRRDPPRPRRICASAGASPRTKRAPTRSRGGARRASAPRARTSKISAIRARSRNMPRWWWRGGCAATPWTN